jgi:hypothetical protein
MEMNLEVGKLSVEADTIDRKALLAQLRQKFEEDVAGAILEEVEKRAREKGVSLRG